MNTLRELLQDYLTMRRALGFKLHTQGTGLLSFVSFMEQAQAEYITVELALSWAQLPAAVQPNRWAQRLCYVRGFARYCSAIDARTEVPPAGLLPHSHHRPSPYFFTDEDIEGLLQGALRLPAKDGLANHTYYCLFGLLSVTGLRIGEALGLNVEDVNLDEGILTILSAKCGKSRLVPLHPTTVAALAAYQKQREDFLAGHQVPHWFVDARSKRLNYDAANAAFHRLTTALPKQSGRSRPRMHDLRHWFALSTILHWYRDGEDVERRITALSAFLGHVEVRDTYWYLSACPPLLDAARERLEIHWEKTS